MRSASGSAHNTRPWLFCFGLYFLFIFLDLCASSSSLTHSLPLSLSDPTTTITPPPLASADWVTRQSEGTGSEEREGAVWVQEVSHLALEWDGETEALFPESPREPKRTGNPCFWTGFCVAPSPLSQTYFFAVCVPTFVLQRQYEGQKKEMNFLFPPQPTQGLTTNKWEKCLPVLWPHVTFCKESEEVMNEQYDTTKSSRRPAKLCCNNTQAQALPAFYHYVFMILSFYFCARNG